jgi:shikimate kinase
MNVVLIGYRGCGKTTVGRVLAGRRGAAFVDTDDMIAESTGLSIHEIFATRGERVFRELEQRAIELAVAAPGRVISVGGGAVELKENRQALREYGTVIWLGAPVATLWRRITADPSSASSRPDLAGGGEEEVRALLARRTALYASTAHHIVSTDDRAVDDVVDEIEGLAGLG